MSADTQENLLFGQSGGQHKLARFVDHRETYGPHVVEGFVRTLQHVRIVVDIGAGSGRDLAIVKRCHPPARTIAVESQRSMTAALTNNVDQVHVLDIERDILPLPNESVDLIIANQVLEHTKEVFWIFHEVTRSLRIGGHFLIGVPNIVSLHNRLIMLFGGHPTTHKLCSAHVRPFSKSDTLKFLAACFPDGYSLVSFSGSQFYPFPSRIAKALAKLIPTAAFCIFFLLQKRHAYRSEFLEYPARAHLETNYWTGAFKR